MNITVYSEKHTLKMGRKSYPCAIGKNGFVDMSEGCEGDGKTPLGTYAFRYGFYRADRLGCPVTELNMYAIREDDGWCDGVEDSAYNRPVRLPYPTSTEKLYREDHVYDIVLVLGHNDSPPIAGMGSAIFIHVARNEEGDLGNYKPTQGCVAVSLEHMLEVLSQLNYKSEILIKT